MGKRYVFKLTGELAGKTMRIGGYVFVNGEYAVHTQDVAEKQARILCVYHACELIEEDLGEAPELEAFDGDLTVNRTRAKTSNTSTQKGK